MRRVRIRAVAAGAAIALAASLVAACGSDSTAGGGGGQTSANETGSAPSSEAGGTESSMGSTTESSAGSSAESSAGMPSSAGEGEGSESAAASGSTPGSSEGGSSGGAVDLSKDTKKDLTIPIASGWGEDVAVTNLWKYVLEKNGYTVDAPTLDIGPVFAGVAGGDYDIFFDTWLPYTHEDYWKQFGDQVTDIGVWYDSAPLTIAVPNYMDIDSLADLKSIGDKVDKTIYGIDPGAGLTRVTKTKMMPAYGLDDWTLKTSSTSAMLAELKSATEAEKPIVVTLWRPHWAYAAFPIKDLKDPKGAMGKPDQIHVIGSKDFSEADPGLLAALKNFHMDDASLGSLEQQVLREHKDDPQAGVEAWAKDNQDFIDGMLGG